MHEEPERGLVCSRSSPEEWLVGILDAHLIMWSATRAPHVGPQASDFVLSRAMLLSLPFFVA